MTKRSPETEKGTISVPMELGDDSQLKAQPQINEGDLGTDRVNIISQVNNDGRTIYFIEVEEDERHNVRLARKGATNTKLVGVRELLASGFSQQKHSNQTDKEVSSPSEKVELPVSFTDGFYGDGDKKRGLLHSFLAALGLHD